MRLEGALGGGYQLREELACFILLHLEVIYILNTFFNV